MEKAFTPLEISSFKELSEKDIPQVEALVDNFLPGKGVFLFCGSSKIGKSWMALQLGFKITTGTPLWNFDTVKKDVLYLCLEDGERRLQERMFKMSKEFPDEFHYATKAALIGKGLEEQLEQMLEEYPRVGLVIIDTFAAVRSLMPASVNSNPYNVEYQTISSLHKIADERDIVILLIHHVRKMKSEDPYEDILGTNGLFGAADGAFIFRKKDYTDPDVQLYLKNRDMEERILTIRFNKTTYNWELLNDNTPIEDALQNDEDVRKTVEYVMEHKQFEGSATELCEKIGSTNKPQSLSVKLNNRISALAKVGISFNNAHTRTGSHIVLKLTEQEQDDDYDPNDEPYEIRDDEPSKNVYTEKAVTASQPSQLASITRRNAS